VLIKIYLPFVAAGAPIGILDVKMTGYFNASNPNGRNVLDLKIVARI
jgi:hypothetical protein